MTNSPLPAELKAKLKAGIKPSEIKNSKLFIISSLNNFSGLNNLEKKNKPFLRKNPLFHYLLIKKKHLKKRQTTTFIQH